MDVRSKIGAHAIVATLCGYITALVGLLAHSFWFRCWGEGWRDVVPPISQLAALWWALPFAVLMTILALGVFAPRRWPAISRAVSGIIVWAWLFMICYGGFTGPMSLHHAPRFEFTSFIGFAFGLFPVTAVAMALSMICALSRESGIRRSGADQGP